MVLTQNLKLKAQSENLKRKSELKYRCYDFSIAIIKFIEFLPNKKTFFIISDQLLRCATSIGANVIETKSSSSKKEFIRFYQIALKSANETKYWLCLLRDAFDNINKETIENLLNEVNEISKMLASSIITLKNKRF